MADATSSAPGFTLTIGSNTYTQTEGRGLEMLVIEDHVDMVDMLIARIGQAEGQPQFEWEIAQEVECAIGNESEPFFKGEVTAIEFIYAVDGTTVVEIRALDRTHRLGRGRKSRIWENETDSSVVQEVAAECGLSVEADDTGEVRDYIIQRNESNVAFLKRLAARNNYVLKVEDDKVIFRKASFTDPGQTIRMGENLRNLRVQFNSAELVQEVVVRGWDIFNKQEVVGTATSADVESVGGATLGIDIAAAFGTSTGYVTDVPVGTQGLADQVAKAELNRIARRFARGMGQVTGNPAIRAGTMITLEGLQDMVNQPYYVLSSRHAISAATGYVTEFTFCSNAAGT